MAPIALTDQQLQQIRQTAGPIPRQLRSAFPRRLAELLGTHAGEIGDGTVHAAAAWHSARSCGPTRWRYRFTARSSKRPENRHFDAQS